MTYRDPSDATLAIRPATPEDTAQVTRLAALDSTSVPDGPLLLGLADGCAQVAVSVTTGTAIADPFSPTADLVELVRARADRLRAGNPDRRRHRRLGTRLAFGR